MHGTSHQSLLVSTYSERCSSVFPGGNPVAGGTRMSDFAVKPVPALWSLKFTAPIGTDQQSSAGLPHTYSSTAAFLGPEICLAAVTH